MFINYFNEEQVWNYMNNTNLEYINIYGLFDKYDIEIPFDNTVNIFIGENGLGKTTILNCIYFVLEKKYSKLANIDFSEIWVKFKTDTKVYKISIADIMKFNRNKRGSKFRYSVDYEDLYNIISDYNIYTDNGIVDSELLSYNISKKLDIPLSVAKRQLFNYLEDERIVKPNKRKANENNVLNLMKATTENIKDRIIYLPTYRRIEDDFESLNFSINEIDKSELLIRFGMSDVQTSIDWILDRIRSLAMKGFTEMTGVLLKQYTNGTDSIEEFLDYEAKTQEINSETVKIVLDRVGNEIEDSYKNKILSLIYNKDINHYNYLYLKNLIIKLIGNYDLQRAYDDRIKKFAETCNKYMNNKHFNYNQSTLDLQIYLDDEFEERKIIKLTQLSSGEKQIVSLFSKLYLESDEGCLVIIDEPELSLSLPWQKMLLPDIMRAKNCKLLITVTHSPFIFDNEFDDDAKEIRRYIKMTK